MNLFSKSHLENQPNMKKKNIEILNNLEKKCEGLENLLCKKVINTISSKIENIEKNISSEYETTKKPSCFSRINIRNNNDEKFDLLNKNLEIIESSLKSNYVSNDSQYSEVIRKKVEENYMLLNELEKTNKPIFSTSTEINNSVFVENKIKEMDSKLNLMFRSDNAKNYSERNINIYTNNSRSIPCNKLEPNSNLNRNTDTVKEKAKQPASEKSKSQINIEIKKKELYDKLISTEKRIKEIAGNLLKNF